MRGLTTARSECPSPINLQPGLHMRMVLQAQHVQPPIIQGMIPAAEPAFRPFCSMFDPCQEDRTHVDAGEASMLIQILIT